jgi:thiol-disulfide isomerase/thioredoxin
MKKSTKLIIEIVAVVVIFAVASIAYNKLKDESTPTSYVPTISAEKSETIVATNAAKKLEKKDLEEKGDSVQIESTKSSDQTTSNNDEVMSATVQSSESTVDEESNEDASQSDSNVMPDIPVIMYPSKEESTFWDVIPMGKPVVINLFASWCPPCKAEMPDFVETRATYKDEVTFVFFDSLDGSRETEETLKAFADKTFEDDTLIVMDPGYLNYLFNSNSIPLTIILNAKGEIVNGFQGSISKETLVGEIEKLLN